MQYPGPRLTVVTINKALLFLDLERGYTQELIPALKISHLHIRTLRFYLEKGKTVAHFLEADRGAYLYVLEGGPVQIDGHLLPALAAAKISGEPGFEVQAQEDGELLIIDVLLI
jgi:redox-sensitive bicupin YhaK (pirin superfamily)